MILLPSLVAVAAEPEQRVRIELLAEPRTWDPEVVAVLHRPSGDERVRLDPLPGRDGFYGGETRGVASRMLDVDLVGADGTVWRRVVPADGDELTLTFRAEQGRPVTRVAWIPAIASFPEGGNLVSLAVAFGWGSLCLGYVAWLVRARR